MIFRRLGFLAVFTMCFCLSIPTLPAQPTKVRLDVSGIAKDHNGKYFAIVRGVGIVQEGDIIPFSINHLSYKVKVVSIDKSGLKVKRFDIVNKQAKHQPDPDTKPKKKHYKHRDPFWPVGYDPRSA